MKHYTSYIGIDVGTSGVRAIAIDDAGIVLAECSTSFPAPETNGPCIEQDPAIWWAQTHTTLTTLVNKIDHTSVTAIAVDGTSATVCLTDTAGQPIHPALMYNDARSVEQTKRIALHADRASAAHGATSSLAKLLWLQDHGYCANASHLMHQADWIACQLGLTPGLSDQNNCLKLGYDPIHHRWPDWMQKLNVPMALLPTVKPAGSPLSTMQPALAKTLGLPNNVRICAGTTDSTAAFIASGAAAVGDAVTALGSTLVVKVLSDTPIFAPKYGVYSQPLFDHWLVGGASNSGGAVLLQHFTQTQLSDLTPKLRPDHPTGLDYYPLPRAGERFPINDPTLPPRLTPRPDDDIIFLQGLLEGMAAIEQRAYQLLSELGAPYPQRVLTNGGGAGNAAWTQIRKRYLQRPVSVARHQQAAYGAAQLAKHGVKETA